MTIEYVLVLILGSLFQSIIVHQGLNIISEMRYVHRLIEFCIYIIYLTANAVISLYLNNIWANVLINIMLIVMVSLLYEIKLIKRFVFPVILSALFILTEIFMGLIVTSLTNMTVAQTQENIYFYLQGVIGSKLLVFFTILVFKQFMSSKYTKLSVAMTVTMCILPVAVNVILFAISELMIYNTNKTLSVVMTSGVVAFLLSIIILMYSIEKNISDKVSKIELEYVNNEMENQLLSVNMLIEKYKFSNKNMHDMKNKLLALKGMSSDNLNFKKELEEADEILNFAENIVYTGITSLDAILNEKFSIMTALGVKFNNKIAVSDIKIDEIKIAMLIANLLDNAIEESERLLWVVEKCCISIDVVQMENQLHIKVVNNKRNLTHSEVTSKKNKYKHGYGTQIIDNLTKELNGVISREISENEYVVKIMIVI